MLTVVSIPKPFSGSALYAQERAVASWLGLAPDVQVLLAGDDSVRATASRLETEYVPDVAVNRNGTPLLSDTMQRVGALARHRLMCFVNADIVLLPDLLPAVRRAAQLYASFLLVGQTRELDVTDEDLLVPETLGRRALAEGVPRGATAIDWFVFPVGMFDPMPPFAVGRAAFDNWMIWRARQVAPVIDATRAVIAIHQPHAYDHLAGGKDEAYYGVEANENRRLAGGKKRLYTLYDASHRMGSDLVVRRNPVATFRVGETVRKAAWKLRAS